METAIVNGEVVIKFKLGEYNKDIVELLRMIEISNKCTATDEEIDNLAKEIKTNWWNENKKRFID